MKVTVSLGNRKLGDIPSVSLLPEVTCRELPCRKSCYARRLLYTRPTLLESWKHNTLIALNAPKVYFREIGSFLDRWKPHYFRFHIAGDFPSQEYVDGVFDLGRGHKETAFMAFTKQYYMDYSRRPENVNIIFSSWPGLEMPERGFPVAYVQDGTEGRAKEAIECSGACDNCYICFGLKPGKSVVFRRK